MQFIGLSADHESHAFRERNIILWVSHLHVLCLKVPVHHETLHEEDITEKICQECNELLTPNNVPIFMLSPILWEVDSRLGT